MTKRESELMMKGWDKEISALKTELAAWYSQFGTTQLSHALAERDRLQRENAQLAAALAGLLKLIDDGDLVRDISQDADTMKFMQQGFRITNALKAAAEPSSALRDLLAPLANELARARGGADFGSWLRVKAVEVGLRALVKEGQ